MAETVVTVDTWRLTRLSGAVYGIEQVGILNAAPLVLAVVLELVVAALSDRAGQ